LQHACKRYMTKTNMSPERRKTDWCMQGVVRLKETKTAKDVSSKL